MTARIARIRPKPAIIGVLRSRYAVSLFLPVLALLLLLYFGWQNPRILSSRNLANILVQTSYLSMFAMAQAIVILVRGFDLSLGTCVSMVSVVATLVMTSMAPHAGDLAAVTCGLLAAISAGAAVGLFNGAISAGFAVSSFVVSLGTLNICFGIASTISGGRPVTRLPDLFNSIFYDIKILSQPISLYIIMAIALFVHFVLTGTVFGRSLYLIGGNPRAAHVAGIPVRRFTILAFTCASVLTAFGALMLTARTGSGEPSLGGNLLLQSISAAAIGGVSLRGGIGGVPQAIIGALLITVLSNGMNLTRVDGNVQQVVLGSATIAFIALHLRLSQRR